MNVPGEREEHLPFEMTLRSEEQGNDMTDKPYATPADPNVKPQGCETQTGAGEVQESGIGDMSTLHTALDLLRQWMSRGYDFWPKEEAIQGWFCAALRESQFVTHPMQIVQEVHLGEKETSDLPEELRTRIQKGLSKSSHVRFDVVALAGKADGDVRNMESMDTPPPLVAEIKALNSAGGLSRRQLQDDSKKLSVAKTYLDGRFLDNRTVALLLVVATACKGVDTEADGVLKLDWLQGWMEDTAFTREIPSNVTVALVLRDKVVWVGQELLPGEDKEEQ